MTTHKALFDHCKFVADELKSVCDGTNEDYGDLYEYISDALDVEYTVNSRLEYLGAELLIAYGGPNVYVNTRTGSVEGYWGGEHIDYLLDRDAADALYALMEELFEATRG